MAEIEVELSPLLRGRKVDLRTPRDLSRYFRYEARWYHPHTPGVLLKQNSNNEDCAVIKTAVINLQPWGTDMIKQGSLEEMIYKFELVPQAIVALPVERIAKQLGLVIEKGHDDFDEYFGAAAWLDGVQPFTVMHYRGHPEDTSTIYLPFNIRDTDKITALIGRIASELKLPPKTITWQRKDNPEL